jgi:hypothetical protein
MIGHIYYLIGLVVFFSIISIIFRFKKIYFIREWKDKYEKVTGNKPLKSQFRTKTEYSKLESYNILVTFELIWVLFGLISNSWSIFLSIIIISYILNILIKPIKYTMLHRLTIHLFIIVKLLVYGYLILNHFYLHIENLDIIKEFLQLQ